MLRTVDSILMHTGRPFIRAAIYLSKILTMVRRAMEVALWEQPQGRRVLCRVIAAQIYFTGWQALPLISLLAVGAGALILFHTSDQSWLWGGDAVSTHVLYQVAFKELGPLLTSLVVIARSGTAVAAELGTQRANRESEALKTMAIDPQGFVVFPRLVGGVLSVVCLAFYFDVASVMGGYLVSYWSRDISLGEFWYNLILNVSLQDLILIGFKNCLNGFIIFAVACFQGQQVKHSLHEVPQVTTKAVVITTTTIVLLNLTITLLTQLARLSEMGIR